MIKKDRTSSSCDYSTWHINAYTYTIYIYKICHMNVHVHSKKFDNIHEHAKKVDTNIHKDCITVVSN